MIITTRITTSGFAAGLKALALSVAAALLATAATVGRAAPEAGDETARINEFFEEVFQRRIAESPTLQAELGIKTADYGKWDDVSDAFAARQVEGHRRDLARLRSGFDLDRLNASAKISYRIFEHAATQRIEDWQWRHHEYLAFHLFTIATDIPAILLNVHEMETKADAEAYVSRLIGVETLMKQLVERLRGQEQRGILAPKFDYPRVIGDLRKVISGAPFDSSGKTNAVLANFESKVAALRLDPQASAALADEARAALLGPFKRGYDQYIAELERLERAAKGDFGVWNLPQGAAYYRNRIRFWTQTDMSADQIHDLGLREVARIQQAMEGIKRSLGFTGSLEEFFEHVRNDAQNGFANDDAGREQYLAEAKKLVDGVYAVADRYFNLLPGARLEIRRVEAWREDSSPIAFYKEPSPEGDRPGVYYVNLKDMKNVQKHAMNSLAYHEGVPGHHFQIAIAQSLEDLPSFRKYSHIGAYTEGWALYAEQLAWEMGLYADQPPLRDFGRLQFELLRAARLVVDSGLHARRWSRERAIGYMKSSTPVSEGDIVKEVGRYLVNPGQALSYKIGMMKILELRELARARLGEAFDIREFHDVVLKNGAMPLPVLQEAVEEYVAAKRTRLGITRTSRPLSIAPLL